MGQDWIHLALARRPIPMVDNPPLPINAPLITNQLFYLHTLKRLINFLPFVFKHLSG
jgi:hypothetical protein